MGQKIWNLQKEIIQLLLDTSDLEKLQYIKGELLKKKVDFSKLDEIVGSRPGGTPVTRKQLIQSIQESEDAIRKGETISMVDLEKIVI